MFETFLIDNGKCDGLPNTEICGYDNGECCDSNKNCSYCGTCLCHLDGLKYCYEEGGNEFVGPGLTQNPTLPELEVVGPGLTQNPTPPELPVAPTPELEGINRQYYILCLSDYAIPFIRVRLTGNFSD